MQQQTTNIRNTVSKFAIFFLTFMGLFVFILPSPALADPHAMFYTDRAQEQLFYNVLAALNPQAPPDIPTSYEPTSPPNIDYNTRVGNYLASGKYFLRTDQREASVQDGVINVGPGGTPTALEPQERTNLPHITVRQVTSDNGDAFLRESLQRRALAEQMRVEIAGLSCRILEGIYGPQAVKDPNNSQANSNNGSSPCDEYLKGDKLIFAQ